MKTTLYNIFLLSLLLPSLSFATPDTHGGKYKKEKTINKEFKVSAGAMLKINNSYGNLDIITWDENRIVFEIKITTSGNDEERVTDKLNAIDVAFSGDSNFVTAETKFSSQKNSSWWSWINKNNVNMSVNYIVKMPITNAVNLENDYGNINLDRLEGKATLSCDYGKITTKELLADNNDISFDYSNNCYFEYIKSGKINADYSGFTIAKTNSIDIIADYTQSKIEIAESVDYNCDYGGITIEKVNTVKGNGDYLTTVIGDVYKNVSIEADYGSIKIENLTRKAGNVNIKSDYVGIKIGYDPEYHFNFDIDIEYGSLRDADGFEFNKKRIESTDKYYLGYYGSENAGPNVQINSDYGSVSFYKN